MNLLRAAGAGVVLLVATGCGDNGSPDRDATERMFLETCAPGGADAEVAVCRCAFERLTADLSDEEVEELDRSVRGAVDELPDDVVEAAVECAADPLTPPTPPPPVDDDDGGDDGSE